MNAAVKNSRPEEAELFLAVIKKLLYSSSEEITGLLEKGNINWDNFKELSTRHELMPLVSYVLKGINAKMPQDFEHLAKNSYQSAVIKCLDFWHEFLNISDAFRKAGITFVPLKGIALLPDIYESSFLRNMSDMDIVVREKDMERAEAILSSLGYKKNLLGLNEEYWRQSHCNIIFCKERGDRPLLVELHWGIDFKRKGQEVLTECWDRLRQIEYDNTKITVLSPEDTFISLALHARRMMKNSLSLKNALDAALLLNKYASSFDWGYCLDKSRKYGFRSNLFFLLCQIKLISGARSVPEYVWKKLNVPFLKRRIIESFINNNTFSPDLYRLAKGFYLKIHFLLYDSWLYPAFYIIDIPLEQFATYYDLPPYDRKTALLYRYRLVYMLLRQITGMFLPNPKFTH